MSKLEDNVNEILGIEKKEKFSLKEFEQPAPVPEKIDETKSDVDNLKDLGVGDGEILEANQIICYFNYVNRSINGLGVTTEGDIVGYYSNAD